MLAIIPARGGSKGLPGKNVRPLLGRPLIAHAVEAAKAARSVDRIVVSTDDGKIAQAALAAGAEVPFLRPAHLAGDDARAADVYLDCCARLEAAGGPRIASFVALQPTSPLRGAADIDAACAIFGERNADAVVSVCPVEHPWEWLREIGPDGVLRPLSAGPASNANRQAARQAFVPNGAIFVFRRDFLAGSAGNYYSDRTYPYVMPRSRGVDIDTIEDFEYAEYLMRRREGPCRERGGGETA